MKRRFFAGLTVFLILAVVAFALLAGEGELPLWIAGIF